MGNAGQTLFLSGDNLSSLSQNMLFTCGIESCCPSGIDVGLFHETIMFITSELFHGSISHLDRIYML
jgi:hypothetical protein